MVQEYLNEIAPTMNGPNKLKTSGKPLRIADLQPPASGQDKPDTLYINLSKYSRMYLPVESALMAWWLGTSKTDAGTVQLSLSKLKTPLLAICGVGGVQGCVIFSD